MAQGGARDRGRSGTLGASGASGPGRPRSGLRGGLDEPFQLRFLERVGELWHLPQNPQRITGGSPQAGGDADHAGAALTSPLELLDPSRFGPFRRLGEDGAVMNPLQHGGQFRGVGGLEDKPAAGSQSPNDGHASGQVANGNQRRAGGVARRARGG